MHKKTEEKVCPYGFQDRPNIQLKRMKLTAIKSQQIQHQYLTQPALNIVSP